LDKLTNEARELKEDEEKALKVIQASLEQIEESKKSWRHIEANQNEKYA
jgi:hypothetical protein